MKKKTCLSRGSIVIVVRCPALRSGEPIFGLALCKEETAIREATSIHGP